MPMMVSTARSMVSRLTYSKRPCMFSPPAKRLGVGMPIKEILEPSVPPRIGSMIGWMSRLSMTALAIWIGVMSFSMTCFML